MSPFLLSPVMVPHGVNTQTTIILRTLFFYCCHLMEKEEQVIDDKKIFKHRSLIRWSFKSLTQIRYNQIRIQTQVHLNTITKF